MMVKIDVFIFIMFFPKIINAGEVVVDLAYFFDIPAYRIHPRKRSQGLQLRVTEFPLLFYKKGGFCTAKTSFNYLTS